MLDLSAETAKERTVKTDFELQRDVLDELAWEPSVEAAEIGVSVQGGVVTLNGSVKTFNQKWAAESTAQRVAGVIALTDELIVKPDGNDWHSDEDLARAAVEALDWSSSVPRGRVKVVVDHAKLLLEGAVEFRFQRDAAEAAVRDLRGIHSVTNMITVQPLVPAVDVQRQIEKALERNARLDARKIKVFAEGKTVTLTGNVPTWAEREFAERAAWAARGVAQVHNQIRIVPLLS
jgi:osmotically-inducible protein OsmY